MLILYDFEAVPPSYTGTVQRPSSQEWYKEGLVHREGLPAIEFSDTDASWWFKGRRNRTESFAWIGATVNCLWFLLDEFINKKAPS